MIIADFVAKYLLKVDVLHLLGGITGGMTSTPSLGTTSSMTKIMPQALPIQPSILLQWYLLLSVYR